MKCKYCSLLYFDGGGQMQKIIALAIDGQSIYYNLDFASDDEENDESD